MAEDVNFPLDQSRSTSSFQGLQEASQEAGRPRRIEDQKEDLNKPDQAQEEQGQKPVNEAESLEARIQISQTARQQAGADLQKPTDRQNQDSQQDIAEAERRELQANRQDISEDARTEFRNPRSQGPAGANEVARTSEGSALDPEESLDEVFQRGNAVSNPDQINEFQNGVRIDSVQKAIQQAGEDAVPTEQESLGSQLREEPSIRELARDASAIRSQEDFEQTIAPDTPSPDETAKADLQENKVSAIDSKIQERLNEERAQEELDALRNEPAIETPRQVIEPVERPVDPIEEGLDTNPLRVPDRQKQEMLPVLRQKPSADKISAS